jgi:hypothetical protein
MSFEYLRASGIVRGMRLYWSLTGKFRWQARGWDRLIEQRSSAIRTIHIIYANHTLALRTARAQFVAAARAEVESRLDCVPTLRAGTAPRLSQDEVEDNTQAIGNKNRYQRPKCGAHPAAFRVTVHIADKKQITARPNARQKTKQRPRPCWRSARMASHSNIEKPLCGSECDYCQRPCPRRNNLDFRRQSSLSFVFYLHRFVNFLIATAAIVLRCWSNKCHGPATTYPPPVPAR